MTTDRLHKIGGHEIDPAKRVAQEYAAAREQIAG